MKHCKNNFNKIRFCFILIAFLAVSSFGQLPEYCNGYGYGATIQKCLERLAQRYGLETAKDYFTTINDSVVHNIDGKEIVSNFKDFDNISKDAHISANINKYKEYIHVEVTNILEKKAANKKKKNFAVFVADKQGEPDISTERVRNFKESGYYIAEYEKYIDGK